MGTMTRWWPLLLILWATAAGAWTAREGDRLLSGETLLTDRTVADIKGVSASFFVKADADEACRVLTDYERMPEFMPNMDAIEVLEREGNRSKVRMKGPHGEMITVRQREGRQIRFHLVSAPMIKTMEGSWSFEPFSEGCIVTYTVAVRPSVPVPEFITLHLQRQSLPELISHVRRRLENGGTWRKPGFRSTPS